MVIDLKLNSQLQLQKEFIGGRVIPRKINVRREYETLTIGLGLGWLFYLQIGTDFL